MIGTFVMPPVSHASKNADDEAIAVGAITSVSNAFGGLIGSAVEGEILDLLGIGGSPDYSTYFEKIESQLDKISGQLTAVQKAVADVQNTANAILAQVAELRSELKQVEVDIELQALLGKFSDCAIIISENFETYTNAWSGIASKDPNTQAAAAKQLFDLFSTLNLQNISISMQNMQALFEPTFGIQKGIPQLLLSRIQPALDASVADRGLFSFYSLEGWGPEEYKDTYSCSAVAPVIERAATPAVRPVAPIFSAFVTCQMQALTLLTTAWIRTDQAPQVMRVINGLRRCVGQLDYFCQGLVRGNSTWGGVNAYMKDKSLEIASKTSIVMHPEFHIPVTNLVWRIEDGSKQWTAPPGLHPPIHFTFAPYPLGDDWVMTYNAGWYALVFRPWGPDGDLIGIPVRAGTGAYLDFLHPIEPGPSDPAVGLILHNPNLSSGQHPDWLAPRFDPDELHFVSDVAASFPAGNLTPAP